MRLHYLFIVRVLVTTLYLLFTAAAVKREREREIGSINVLVDSICVIIVWFVFNEGHNTLIHRPVVVIVAAAYLNLLYYVV